MTSRLVTPALGAPKALHFPAPTAALRAAARPRLATLRLGGAQRQRPSPVLAALGGLAHPSEVRGPLPAAAVPARPRPARFWQMRILRRGRPILQFCPPRAARLTPPPP
jgi:hypothetical protein